MSRFFKISFVGFVRGLVMFVLLAMSLLAGLQLLMEPHVNVIGKASSNTLRYNVIEAPIDSRDIAGVDVRWVSPLKMDFTGVVTLASLYLILPFTYLLLSAAQKRLEKGIVGKGSMGEDICLRPEAVERVINREVRAQVEDVTRVTSCEVTQGSSAACVKMSVAVSDRSTVPDVQKRVRAVVKDALTRLIGYADGTQITVKVVEVAGAAPSAARRKGPARTNRTSRTRRELPPPPAVEI
ncbi:MAG: hypothetical protein ABI579_07815 [Candidatus Sumerlaeota bacterium]